MIDLIICIKTTARTAYYDRMNGIKIPEGNCGLRQGQRTKDKGQRIKDKDK